MVSLEVKGVGGFRMVMSYDNLNKAIPDSQVKKPCRPEGWDDKRFECLLKWAEKGDLFPFPTEDATTTYEAGADAMYTLLKDGKGISDGEGGYYKLTHWLKPRIATFSGWIKE
ncbi:hypothetical protein LCGC14_1267190 [marine sediment metagenome]|uniref:Uncharacterized protein n=1 Tax=marine sediment metagenome TaxID=412755 RepID=A0A0F9P2B0_9ZZZZ